MINTTLHSDTVDYGSIHRARPSSRRKWIIALGVVAFLLPLLSACGNISTRLSEVGREPELSDLKNPTAQPGYRPVSMPTPPAEQAVLNPNSLWRPGAKAFFKDQRAKTIGDILTVKLDLADSASLANKTERDRSNSEDVDIVGLLGYEDELTKILPEGATGTNLGNFGSTHSTSGDGSIDRSETVNLEFAAVVTQMLPNGSFVILGRQEVRVNSELRELEVSGVVRPEDISQDNTIEHTKIAEMRVAYGGRGTISDLQQPRWGMQIWDILFPF